MRTLLVLACLIATAACSRGSLGSLDPAVLHSTASLVRPHVLHFVPFFSFKGGKNGAITPEASSGYGYGGLIGNPSVALFGVTASGGDLNCGDIGGCGVVYELQPQSGKAAFKETILHAFSGPDGDKPYASVIRDSKGALYGTTYEGGAHFNGTVFKLTPSGSGYVESVLYSFAGPADGEFPASSVIVDSKGNIFGTATYGGTYGFGVAFELVRSSTTYTERVLHTFSGAPDGAYPDTGLLADSHGALYGMTNSGGTGSAAPGYGAVFKLTPSGSGYAESILYGFAGGEDGRSPGNTSLISDKSGALYGTTPFGGDGDNGVVFVLRPNGSAYFEQVLHEFADFTDGIGPFSGLVMADGLLYGTTSSGGYHITCDGVFDGCGAVYSLSTTGGAFSVIHTFTGRREGGLAFSTMLFAGGSLYGTTLIGGKDGYGTAFKLSP